MTPEIKAAVKRAKTCAPARCLDEGICFKLAIEVERLHRQLEPSEPKPDPIYEEEIAGLKAEEPNYEFSLPIWGNRELWIDSLSGDKHETA